MGTGICYFSTGKMGFGLLGLGMTNKEIGMGPVFAQK